MADRLNVKFSFTAVDAADNSPFSDVKLEWSGLPYADLVEMQGLLTDTLNKMQAWGKMNAEAKKAKRK